MHTSLAGIELIKKHEKLRLRAYKPTPRDRWTIGYGTTVYPSGRPVNEGDSCSKILAEAYLKYDLIKREASINERVKVKLTQSQFDALVSLVYNIGVGAFAKSTLLRWLNQGEYILAANQFDRWVKQKGIVLKGLVKRRAEEKALFLQGLDNGSKA